MSIQHLQDTMRGRIALPAFLQNPDLYWWALLGIALFGCLVSFWHIAFVGATVQQPTTQSQSHAGLSKSTSANESTSPITANEAQTWAWFGIPKGVAKKPVVIAAADTKLNLALFGVAVGNSGESSLAVIGINGQPEAAYQPGQRLPVHGHVTLTRVLHDRVLLDHDGSTEQLLLYKFASDRHDTGGRYSGYSAPSAAPSAQIPPRRHSAPVERRTIKADPPKKEHRPVPTKWQG